MKMLTVVKFRTISFLVSGLINLHIKVYASQILHAVFMNVKIGPIH
jgi:hypothetical protein